MGMTCEHWHLAGATSVKFEITLEDSDDIWKQNV